MKKLFLSGLALFFIKGLCFCTEREPQFRLWKSSALDGANYQDIAFTSSPIIVHAIDIASPTVNQGGNSFFAMYNTTNPTLGLSVTNPIISTRIYCALDQGMAINSTSHTYDFLFSSMTFYNKQGGARVNILWDWYLDDGRKTQAAHVGD